MFSSYTFPNLEYNHCGTTELKFQESREVCGMGRGVGLAEKIECVQQFLKNHLKFATIFENTKENLEDYEKFLRGFKNV